MASLVYSPPHTSDDESDRIQVVSDESESVPLDCMQQRHDTQQWTGTVTTVYTVIYLEVLSLQWPG